MEKVESSHIAILPYFGDLNFFRMLINKPTIIEAHDNYQKKTHRNKTCILSSNGKQTLSVPLKRGKHQNCGYKTVEIFYEDPWVKSHIESIRSAYGNAPYFHYYFDSIRMIIEQKPKFLWDFNFNILMRIIKSLQLDIELDFTETFQYDKFKEPESLILQSKPYPQVFEHKYGFIDNLSILDLLFNLGPESRSYLTYKK